MLDLSGVKWRKSSRSGYNGCVEVAFLDGHIAVRDSKDPQGPVLLFTPTEWRAFLGGIRDGQFEFSSDSADAAPSDRAWSRCLASESWASRPWDKEGRITRPG